MFRVDGDDGGDVIRNLTYVRNENFTNNDNEPGQTLNYDIKSEQELCQIRSNRGVLHFRFFFALTRLSFIGLISRP